METVKQQRLEAAGFRVGSVAEFLGLTPEENELVEIKAALSQALKERCGTQKAAKMEAGDPHISLDLMIKALVAAGMTRRELAAVIAGV